MMSSTQRLTLRLAHPELELLVEHLQHRHRVDRAAVDADERDGAAAADARRSRRRAPPAGRARLLDHRAGPAASGSKPSEPAGRAPPTGDAVRLHADRVDHRVGAAAVGELADARRRRRRTARRDVDHLDTARRDRASRSGTRSTPITRAPRCWAIRAAMSPIGPSPRTASSVPPSGTSAYSTACQAVGSTSERKRKRSSGGPSGHLDRPELGLRDAQVLRLAAGHLAVQLGVAEERRRPCPCRGPAWSRTARRARCSHIQQWPQEMLNGITTRSPLEVARPRRRPPRRCPSARGRGCRPASMNGAEHLVEVQVRAAEPGRGDADDRVGRLLDPRIGNLLDPDVLAPCQVTAFIASFRRSAQP